MSGNTNETGDAGESPGKSSLFFLTVTGPSHGPATSPAVRGRVLVVAGGAARQTVVPRWRRRRPARVACQNPIGRGVAMPTETVYPEMCCSLKHC